MHSYRKLIDDEMRERQWTRQDLERESGLSRAMVHNLVSDKRGRLPAPPHESTVQALAKAFRLPADAVWSAVAEAMGLPRSAAPSITHEVKEVSDVDLFKELASRLNLDVSVRPAKPEAAELEAEEQKTMPRSRVAQAKNIKVRKDATQPRRTGKA